MAEEIKTQRISSLPKSLRRKMADRLLHYNRKAQCLVSETYVNPVTTFPHGRATFIIVFGRRHASSGPWASPFRGPLLSQTSGEEGMVTTSVVWDL